MSGDVPQDARARTGWPSQRLPFATLTSSHAASPSTGVDNTHSSASSPMASTRGAISWGEKGQA